jgi:hypothetical protein
LILQYILICILIFTTTYFLIQVFNKNSKTIFKEFLKKKLGGGIEKQDKLRTKKAALLYFASVILLGYNYFMLYKIASISDMIYIFWILIFIALVIILFVVKKLGFKDPKN